jgi:amino acid transporter
VDDGLDRVERELLDAEGAEALKHRLEREYNELLQELRSLIPGANVLLGFLLAVSFTAQFGELSRLERYVYFVTLVSTAVAIVLFMAPAAHHRLRFREGDKDHILRKGNREAIAGTVASSIAFTGVLYLVTERIFGDVTAAVTAVAFFALTAWRWWSFALIRTLREERQAGLRKTGIR